MKHLVRSAFIFVFMLVSGCASQAGQPKIVPILLDDGVTQHRLYVEIADEPKERMEGLQNRTFMAEDHGMLFDFKREQRVSFWMKNTPLPLDMLFFDAQGILVDIHADAIPNSRKRIEAVGKVRYVLEIGGGLAEQKKISIGTRLQMER